MKKFKDIVREYEDFVSLGEVSESEIKAAETELGIEFDSEYKAFIKAYGAASANAHEFMGICKSKRLNIIAGTSKARKQNANVPDDLYLIEDVGVDKILTWQNKKGELFQTVGKSEPEKLEVDLCEYVNR